MIPYVKGDTVTCYYVGLCPAVVDEVINDSIYLLRLNQIGPYRENFRVAYYYELKHREPGANEPMPIVDKIGRLPIGASVTWATEDNNVLTEYGGILKDYLDNNKYLIYTGNPKKPTECVSANNID